MPNSDLNNQLNRRLTSNSNNKTPSKLESLGSALDRKMRSLMQRGTGSVNASPYHPAIDTSSEPEHDTPYTGPYVSDGSLPQNPMPWEEYQRQQGQLDEPSSLTAVEDTPVVENTAEEEGAPVSPYVARMDNAIEGLLQHYHKSKEAQQVREGSLAGRLGLEQGTLDHRTVDTVARNMARSYGLLGDAASLPFELAGELQELASTGEKGDDPNTSRQLAQRIRQYMNLDHLVDTTADPTALGVFGDGAIKATSQMAEGMANAPGALRTILLGIQEASENLGRAAGLPEWMTEDRVIPNPTALLNPIVDGFDIGDTHIAGSSEVGERLGGYLDQRLRTDDYREYSAQIEQRATQATHKALEGDFGELTDVLTDVDSWAYATGIALPTLLMAMRFGLPAILAMESGGAYQNVAEYAEKNNVDVSNVQAATAILQQAGVNALLERTGSKAVLGTLPKRLQEQFTNQTIDKLESEIAKRGLGLAGRTAVRGGQTVGAGLTEAATEAAQEFNENLAARLHFDPTQDLSEGVLLGAMGGASSGSGIAGAGNIAEGATDVARTLTGSDLGDGLPSLAPEAREVFQAAVAANDPSIYLDTANKSTYNPVRAVEVLSAAARAEGATPELVQANTQRITELITQIQDSAAPVEGVTQEELQANLQIIDEMASEGTISEEQAQTYREQQLFDYEQSQSQPERSRQAERQVRDMTRLRDRLITDTVGRATTEELNTLVHEASTSPEAAQRIVSLAMASPTRLSGEQLSQLARDTSNAFTEPQRTYLRLLSESQILANQAKDANRVQQEILYGDEASGQKGIETYRRNINHALLSGDVSAATRELIGLQRFAQGHRDKSEVSRLALEEAKATGQTITVARSEAGPWMRLDETLGEKQRQEAGALNIHQGSGEQVQAIALEASALDSAVQELQAALRAHNEQPNTTAPTVQEPSSIEEGNRVNDIDSIESQELPEVVSSSTVDSTEVTGIESDSTVDNISTTDIDTINTLEDSINNREDINNISEEVEGNRTDPLAPRPPSENDTSQSSGIANQQSDGSPETSGRSQVYDSPSPEGTPYNERNLIADYTEQVAGKETDSSTRPLVAVRDFISRLLDAESGIKVSDFLPEGFALSEAHRDAIRHYVRTVREWLPKVQQGLRQDERKGGGVYSQRFYQDPAQFFIHAETVDGKRLLDMEENVKAAIATAAYTWAYDEAGNLPFNTDESINRLLGRRSDAPVSPTERSQLREVGVRRALVIQDLGQRVVQALGIRAKDDAPLNLMSNLESALGTHALNLLMHGDIGVVQQNTVPARIWDNLVSDRLTGVEDIEAIARIEEDIRQAGEEVTYGGDQHFISLVRETDKATQRKTPTALARAIREVGAQTNQIINKLIGVEGSERDPHLEPQEFDANRRFKDGQRIPESLAKQVEANQKIEQYVLQDEYSVLTRFDRGTFLDMMGRKDTDPERVQIMERESNEAANAALERELDHLMRFVEHGLQGDHSTPFYFTYDVWSQHRVGINSNTVNPLTSKLQRDFITRKGWSKTIDRANAADMENFKLRIAETFGVKTEQMSIEAAIAKVDAMIAEPALVDGIAAMQEALADIEAEISGEQQSAIANAISIMGEGPRSLTGLVALARWKAAEATGQSSFETQLVGETDGVANGLMLGDIFFGAASSVEELGRRVARGGFYDANNNYTQFSEWSQTPGNEDIYKQTTRTLVKNLSLALVASPKLQDLTNTVFSFLGQMVDHDTGDVTSDGRNFIKKPLQMAIFGSGHANLMNETAKSFLDSVVKRIAKDYQDQVSPQNTVQAINFLLKEGGAKRGIDPRITGKELMERRFTAAEEAAIIRAFKKALDKPLKETVRAELGAFIAVRDTMVDLNTTAFRLYDIAYQNERDAIQASREEGDTTPRDITRRESQAIQVKLKDIVPIIHSAHSQVDGSIEAGLQATKHKNKLERNPAYQSKIGIKRNGKNASVNVNSTSRELAEPGTKLVPTSVHSADSRIAHNVDAKYSTLNLHDAKVSGLNNNRKVAQELNKGAFNTLLEYSPLREAHDGLVRTVHGILEYVKQPGVSPETRQAIAAIVMGEGERPSLREQIEASKRQVAQTDRIRLGYLATLQHVDQYSMEGGSYKVTDADRARAQDALESVSELLSTEESRAIAELEQLFSPTALDSVSPQDAVGQMKARLVESLIDEDSSFVLGFSPARVLHLLDRARRDESLPRALRDSVQALIAHMTTGAKGSLVSGLQDITPYEHIGPIVQYLGEQYRDQPGDHWGDRGRPVNPTDQGLVQIFEQRPVMTLNQVLNVVEQHLQGTYGEHLTGYYRQLIKVLRKKASQDIKVHYITPAMAPEQAMGKVNNARGWYSTDGTQDAIYILGADYVQSGVTAEVVLHELVHSALHGLVEEGTHNADSALAPMVQELESLRQAAIAFVSENNLEVFDGALSSVHELIAWGMTNFNFQSQVLSKISVESQASTPKTALRQFIDTLTNLLVQGLNRVLGNKEAVGNGLSVLIGNVSLMFDQGQKELNRREGTHAMTNGPIDAANAMTSMDIYEALSRERPTSKSFDTHLRDVLGSVVQAVHGPLGTFRSIANENQALTPKDVYTKALDTGRAPFASDAKHSGLKYTEQEFFVQEQVQATVEHLLTEQDAPTRRSYRELERLYRAAQQQIKPEHFYEGDWSQANPTEKAQAQATYDFIFKLNEGWNGRLDYLSRFASMGLAHEGFHRVLERAQLRTEADAAPVGIAARLRSWFEQLLSLVSDRFGRANRDSNSAQTLARLVDTLVDIEAKRRYKEARRENGTDPLAFIDEKADAVTGQVKKGISAVARSSIFKKSRVDAIRAGAALTDTIASGRMGIFVEGLQRVRDQARDDVPGVLAGTLNYVKGVPQAWQTMLRKIKNVERIRKEVITSTAQFTLQSFINEGKDLTDEVKEAITKVFLRTDAHTLVDTYTQQEIADLLSDPDYLNREIAGLETQLNEFSRFKEYFLEQGDKLAYYLAYHINKSPMLMKSAENIVRLYGTGMTSTLTEAEVQSATATLDTLITLYALRYTPESLKDSARQALQTEINREDGGNGVEFVLRQHKHLLAESKAKLFDGSEALAEKGFTPEIHNPYNDVQYASEAQGRELLLRGYKRVSNIFHDPRDAQQGKMGIYVLHGGGNASRATGIVSLTDLHTRGSRTDGNVPGWEITGRPEHRARIRAMFKPQSQRDAHGGTEQYMVPILNPKGEIVAWNYEMTGQHRDSVLERDNRFEHLLGQLAGTTFDKVETPQHNREVVQALYDQYRDESQGDSLRYLEVGPSSRDPKMREAWRLLPEAMKQDIHDIWGTPSIMVRSDLYDVLFGYRKYSLSEVFLKDASERNRVERIVSAVPDYIMTQYAMRYRGMSQADAHVFAKRVGNWIRNAGNVSAELVREMKDIVVIKSGVVPAANAWSNITVLQMHGMRMTDIVRQHRVAIRGALQHREDTEALRHLSAMRDTGYLQGRSAAELDREIRLLEDSIARNPISTMIDEGLMPTIINDVSFEDDRYSYKGKVTDRIEKGLSKLPRFAQSTLKFAYMSKDTQAYKFLSQATQLSDFAARYALYQHLTTQSREPYSHDQAVLEASEAFVNYDVPMPRAVQYLDDLYVLPFSKYFLSIQRVLFRRMQEKPARVLSTLMMHNFLDVFPTVMDTSILGRIGNNPLYSGVMRFPSTLGDLGTVKAAVSIVK